MKLAWKEAKRQYSVCYLSLNKMGRSISTCMANVMFDSNWQPLFFANFSQRFAISMHCQSALSDGEDLFSTRRIRSVKPSTFQRFLLRSLLSKLTLARSRYWTELFFLLGCTVPACRSTFILS